MESKFFFFVAKMKIQETMGAWSCGTWVKRSYEISNNSMLCLNDVRLNDIESCCIMLHFGTAQSNTNDIGESRYASHGNHEVS